MGAKKGQPFPRLLSLSLPHTLLLAEFPRWAPHTSAALCVFSQQRLVCVHVCVRECLRKLGNTICWLVGWKNVRLRGRFG